MNIDQDLISELNNNQREIFITETDELLAAWIYKKRSSSKRSKNMSAVPTKLRCTRPNCDQSELIPCHVSIKEKVGHTVTRVTPAPEYSTISCHGHGILKKISLSELESLDSMDRLEAITLTKKSFSPYASPFFDTVTLARVAKDLGIQGKAIPKVIKGRQYIAFSGYPGMRRIFTGTIYSTRNAKIINMAIGAMGITKMATKGGVITLSLTVPLSIWECYLTDRSAWYELSGSVGADLIKVGTASLLGAIGGVLAAGGSAFLPCLPIGAAILISVFLGLTLEYIDNRYQLTEKLIALLKEIPNEANKAATATGQGIWNVLRSSGFGMGNWVNKGY
jgi:DNA-binding phage protein